MAIQPTFGKIYTYFDMKIVFLCALVGFEAGSIICATARSSPIFILGRAVAGSSAAAIQGGGMIIIALSIPLHKVPLFLGTLTSMTAVAGLTGPPLGGLFTDTQRLSWRFYFWINLPFGGIAALIFLWGFRAPVQKPSTLSFKEKLTQLDIIGTVLFVSSMISLFLALQWGGTKYLWSNSKAWGLILSFGLLLTAFIILQLHLGDRATIPVRTFRNRSLTLSLLASALLYLGTTVHTFYLPFYFQSAKGPSAAGSGLQMLPYTVTLSVSQLVVGSAVASIGLYLPFMWSGAVILTIGAGLLTSLNLNTDLAHPIGYQILAGYGFGSSMQLCATAVRASVLDKEDVPISSALTIFARFFGGSLAAALAQNIFRVELIHSLQDSVAAFDTNAIVAAGAIDGVYMVPEALRGVVREAYNITVSKTFLIAVASGGLAFICTLGIEWKNIKKPAKLLTPERERSYKICEGTEVMEKNV
ncbi:hypothetical protein sscle_13g096390 [Sclerotinia sclerotiorum 1980 UF-70]|uniref:Major facilitator superfamily (MFS) profile domain-containing protein n=1 Tax=Sclerotinia sclerotiorum (strain ATCC 18683 / 1980 / Ss-1) TaxID=665079 RepID=A0A1D9QJ13_SCLS1|nr:hypothetical protein sscle_13g096390 [Sclerotinia sclerotiorum 1980 UF-70]